MWKRNLFLAVVLTLGAATGCASRGYYGGGYYRMPPPRPRVEAYGMAPGPGYVWLNGYWAGGGGGYVWTPGYWARPPRPHARWMAPRWEQRRGGYRFRSGYWR